MEHYGFNFATDVVDPAGRITFDKLKSAIPPTALFFTKNNKITLDSSFFDLFGFYKTSIVSKRQSNGDYNYELNINNVIITHQSQSQSIPDPDFFQGNSKKNSDIINQKYDDNVNYALLVSKELGDILQILYILIWNKLSKYNDYILSTCDQPVYIMCQICT